MGTKTKEQELLELRQKVKELERKNTRLEKELDDKDLPGLFQSADTASIKEQKKFFNGIFWYLTLLIIAALFAFFADDYPNPIFKIIN